MAKNKRSRTSSFSLGGDKNTGKLPSKEEINKTVAKVAAQEEPIVVNEKIKRIPFTTALTPENRALLETASHQRQEAIADILNKAIHHYFDQVAPIQNHEMMNVFLKIYESKSK